MVPISGVSSYSGFELSGSNCIETIAPKPRGREIWSELTRVPVIRGSSYRSYTVNNIFYAATVLLSPEYV